MYIVHAARKVSERMYMHVHVHVLEKIPLKVCSQTLYCNAFPLDVVHVHVLVYCIKFYVSKLNSNKIATLTLRQIGFIKIPGSEFLTLNQILCCTQLNTVMHNYCTCSLNLLIKFCYDSTNQAFQTLYISITVLLLKIQPF